jgi:O-antigen ligase
MRLRESAAQARHPLIAVLFLVAAVVLGGGGSPNPATEVLLQLAFAAAALAWLWAGGVTPVPQSRAVWLVCALVVVLPAAQLVPLPAGAWTALAGQQDRAAALALVGRDHAWQPLTHSPARTLAVLLATIPPLFAFFAAAALDVAGRRWLVGAIAALAIATALLGAVQVSLGPDGPFLYAESHHTLTGFQANRNATADVLLIGIAAGAAFAVPWLAAPVERTSPGFGVLANRRAVALALAGFTALLFFATVLTASRMGITLLPLALLGVCVILSPALAGLGRWRLLPLLVALLAVPVVAIVALRGGNTALGVVADRFLFDEGGRRELWRDAWFAIQQNWPFGVGMGGAQPALIAAERLEVLNPSLPNRVHNDYLELALEGGVPGLLLLAAIAGILAHTAWRSWRDRPEQRHFTAFAAILLIIVAAHSFVDYPLRSMALACLVGTGAGLLIGTPRRLAEDVPSA